MWYKWISGSHGGQKTCLNVLNKETSESQGLYCSSECAYVFSRTQRTAGVRGEGKTNTWPACLWPWEFCLGFWNHLKSCVIKSYAIITHKNSGWKSSLSREHSSPCLSWHTMAVAYFARAMVDHNHILLNILLQRWRLLPGLILRRALVSCYCCHPAMAS